jgi:hypothetical protein
VREEEEPNSLSHFFFVSYDHDHDQDGFSMDK